MSTYRVGTLPDSRLIYRDGKCIGVMFTPEDAALVVEALSPRTPDVDYLRGASEALSQVRRLLLGPEGRALGGSLVDGAKLVALRAAVLLALRQVEVELGVTEGEQP